MKKGSKIIVAAGGSGGHLFPAQGLAAQLLDKNRGLQLLFAGAGLAENPHFDRGKFSFRAVSSMTPFRGNPLKSVKFLLKGIKESYQLLREQRPDLVVGFGSFHSFPVLFAAALQKIPFVLFASDSIPGKVIRLFSRRALFTGVFFEEAKTRLKGKSVAVEIPLRTPRRKIAAHEARLKLGLKADLPTLLVFGGSQGAQPINRAILGLLPRLSNYQLIHMTGSEEAAREVEERCNALGIPSYVRRFEPQMDLLWNAADIALCRSGAMTIAEILAHEVPAIVIPYPFAADRHQHKNAQILEQTIGGGVCIDEERLTSDLLIETIQSLDRVKITSAIQSYKARQSREDLCHLITKIFS